MNEVVFDTQAEAEAKQALDAAIIFAGICCPAYKSKTTRWAEPRQRLDGKWAYLCHTMCDYTGYTVEAFDEANYPA